MDMFYLISGLVFCCSSVYYNIFYKGDNSEVLGGYTWLLCPSVLIN
jgi:hypothetical protein